MHEGETMMSSYFVEATPIITLSTTSAHINSIFYKHKRTRCSANTIAVPYIQRAKINARRVAIIKLIFVAVYIFGHYNGNEITASN